jgi:hypothetical protein
MHKGAAAMTTTTNTNTAPRYEKEITYDRATRDYAGSIDGEIVGYFRSYHEAEIALDQLVFELLSGQYVREVTQ